MNDDEHSRTHVSSEPADASVITRRMMRSPFARAVTNLATKESVPVGFAGVRFVPATYFTSPNGVAGADQMDAMPVPRLPVYGGGSGYFHPSTFGLRHGAPPAAPTPPTAPPATPFQETATVVRSPANVFSFPLHDCSVVELGLSVGEQRLFLTQTLRGAGVVQFKGARPTNQRHRRPAISLDVSESLGRDRMRLQHGQVIQFRKRRRTPSSTTSTDKSSTTASSSATECLTLCALFTHAGAASRGVSPADRSAAWLLEPSGEKPADPASQLDDDEEDAGRSTKRTKSPQVSFVLERSAKANSVAGSSSASGSTKSPASARSQTTGQTLGKSDALMEIEFYSVLGYAADQSLDKTAEDGGKTVSGGAAGMGSESSVLYQLSAQPVARLGGSKKFMMIGTASCCDVRLPFDLDEGDEPVVAALEYVEQDQIFLVLPRRFTREDPLPAVRVSLVIPLHVKFPLLSEDVIRGTPSDVWLPTAEGEDDQEIFRVEIPSVVRRAPSGKPTSASSKLNPNQRMDTTALVVTTEARSQTSEWGITTASHGSQQGYVLSKACFAANRQVARVGRHSESTVVIPDPRMARDHFTLTRRADTSTVGIRSSSPTKSTLLVLGQGTNHSCPRTPLTLGDVVVVGRTELRVAHLRRAGEGSAARGVARASSLASRSVAVTSSRPGLPCWSGSEPAEEGLCACGPRCDKGAVHAACPALTLSVSLPGSAAKRAQHISAGVAPLPAAPVKLYACDPTETLVGSACASGIPIHGDNAVSPVHARILFDEVANEWMVEDLESRSGTCLDVGDREALLVPGDVVQAGLTLIRVLGRVAEVDY